MVGTPDDAVEAIRTLQEKAGEFGHYLQMATDWADVDKTKKSYELYMRFAVPQLDNANAARVSSLDWVGERATQFDKMREAAAAAAIKSYGDDQHKAKSAESVLTPK